MDVDALKSLKNYLLHFFKSNKLKFKINIPIYLVDIDDITNLATLRPTGQPILSNLIISRVTRHRPDLYVDIKYSIKKALERIYVKTDKGRINVMIIDEDDLNLDEIDH
ncbi:hypothetical protein ACOSQ4_005561 [Xanthoceras sorbifolium]